MPVELSNDFVKGLEWLMLAQAQECSWQLAKLSMLHRTLYSSVSIHSGQYRNTLIAKIAAGVTRFRFILIFFLLRATFADILVLSDCLGRHSELDPLSCPRFPTRVSFRCLFLVHSD